MKIRHQWHGLLGELTGLVAIASHRSFRKAADELALSASTLSHTKRGLEAIVGVRLLHRTNPSPPSGC